MTPAPKPFPPSCSDGGQEGTPADFDQKTWGKARGEETAESGWTPSHPPLLAHCPLRPPSALQPRLGCSKPGRPPRPCPHSGLGVHVPPRPPTSYHNTRPSKTTTLPTLSHREGKEHHPACGCQLPTRLHVNLRTPPRPGPQSVFLSGLLQPLPRILHTEKLLRISLPQTNLPNNSAAENVNVLKLRNPGCLSPRLGRAPLFKTLW